MNNNVFGLNVNIWRSLIFGVIAGAIAITATLFLMAFLMTVRDFSVSSAALMSCIAVAIGSLCGGFSAAKRMGSKGMIVGTLTGCVIFILLLIASLIATHTGFTYFSLIKAVIVIISGALGGILGVNMTKKQKYV